MVGHELRGKKVLLRPLKHEDLEDRVSWLADYETSILFTGMASSGLYCITNAELWKRSMEADRSSVVWAVDAADLRHIGDVDIHSIDRYSKSAKLTILLGDKEYWGRGYGTDTIRTLLAHAFSDMGISEVGLRVYDFNKRGIKCYEKCGFNPAGGCSIGRSGLGELYMTVCKESLIMEDPDVISI